MNYYKETPKIGQIIEIAEKGKGQVVSMALIEKDKVSVEIKLDHVDPLTKENLYSYLVLPCEVVNQQPMEERPDNKVFREIIDILAQIQYDKEGTYGSSWKGKGEYRGIMANIDRKYDRLDKMTNDEVMAKIPTLKQIEHSLATTNEMPDGANVESKVDAIADLANYAILYMTYIKSEYPEVYKLWLKHNLPQ